MTGKLLHTQQLQLPDLPAHLLDWSPNGNYFAVISYDETYSSSPTTGQIQIWPTP